MRLIFTYFVLFFYTVGYSQNITGIWRGYFVQNSFQLRSGQFVEDKYKYEIQINDLPNDGIEGVTYSYKTTLFYGKAASQGIYSRKTKVLLLKETKMMELKISDQSVACLMTCYLDYSKSADGTKETLTGNYTSINEVNNSECGSGTVYLERVTNTEFEKEDFIIKKENAAKHKANNSSKKALPNQPLTKPGAEDFMISKSVIKPTKKLPQEDTLQNMERTDTVAALKDTQSTMPVPDVLQKRENVLAAKTFIVDSEDVTIEFYDNGQIDGDTISVYHNNIRIVNSQRLTYSPITMQLHIEPENPIYEFIVVAENLGTVPPNTALVVISSGSKHYEINIASDEQRNAKIVLQYQKPPYQH
jgi:hypothetical protein